METPLVLSGWVRHWIDVAPFRSTGLGSEDADTAKAQAVQAALAAGKGVRRIARSQGRRQDGVAVEGGIGITTPFAAIHCQKQEETSTRQSRPPC
jgi:hypothetical protein